MMTDVIWKEADILFDGIPTWWRDKAVSTWRDSIYSVVVTESTVHWCHRLTGLIAVLMMTVSDPMMFDYSIALPVMMTLYSEK